jgi:GTPase involved in cell partitioning and DNA repair
MFLRHLRRTRLLVHVVDASNPDPLQDFLTLREVSRPRESTSTFRIMKTIWAPHLLGNIMGA